MTWGSISPSLPKGDYSVLCGPRQCLPVKRRGRQVRKPLRPMMMNVYNRFCHVSENGLYYFKDMTLRFLNTETLEETVFDEVEGIPALIHAGANDACWMQGDATSDRYDCFLPDEQGGSYTFISGRIRTQRYASGQEASAEEQETVNTTAAVCGVW